MNLYSITNKTSAQDLGLYPGRTADEALDAYYSDAGYSCRVGAARALDTTVDALLADLIVAQYDYADDLVRLADAMVDDDRTSGECTTDVLDDPDAGGSDHWDRLGIIVAAERIGISRGTVCAIGIVAIRTAYAAAWRAAVELELSSRDDDAAVEAAIRLESDLTRHSRQDDGSYIIAIDEDGENGDAALARIAAALPAGWSIEWTGDHSDAHVSRDEVAS